ncbi:hypothetical protein [Amorphus coralli]|uniref:hypothetical protein n=1 Tax=Amorphus coralli TaxID=340680 RepID=UPI000379F780|nr:hypothetical protein [Amorphus coralli]
MAFSVQQIKFDLLSAIKEFGGDGSDWRIGLSDRPPAEALTSEGLEPDNYVFIGKPAATPRAAEIVLEFMTGRCRVMGQPAPVPPASHNWVYMYREKASLPGGEMPRANGVSAEEGLPGV